MFSAKTKFIKYFFISIFLFLIDQLSKILIIKNLDSGDQVDILNPILIFKRIENKGIAFGIDGNGDFNYILTPLTIILTIAIIVYLYKTSRKNSRLTNLSIALILGGAIGNLFDRIVSGEVVDFIWVGLTEDIRWDFIFNLADSFITIGMIMLLFSDLLIRKKKKNEEQTEKNI